MDGGTWTFAGPQPINGVGTYGATSGRITDIAIDPTSSSIIYAGTAGGGVWKTTNGGTTWSPLSDNQLSLAIGGVAVDPTNSQSLYASTGEDNRCGDCQAGQGILKSTDAGASWSIAGQTGLLGGPIAIDAKNPSHLFIGTDSGLLESGNGGTGWVVSNLNSLSPNIANVDAVFQDPSTPTRFWASVSEGCNASGFIASYDATTSVWSINTRFSAIAGLPWITRAALAEGPGGVLYASLAACNSTTPAYALGQFAAILKSTNGGASWVAIKPTAANHLTDYFNSGPGVEQGDYDNVIAVNPANANQAVFGGVTMLATSDAGGTFTDIAKPYSGGSVHPDFHAAVFNGSTLVVGTDGGVYSTANLGASWTNLNATFAITTFYAGAALDSNHIVGGAQDEGTSGLLPGGPTPPAWRELLGSDGGNVSLDPTVGSTAMYAEAPLGALYKGSTSYYDASPWQLASPCLQTEPACSEPVDFTAPFAVNWSANPPTIFTATNRVYRSTSGGLPAGSAGWSAVSGDLTTGTTINPYGDWITAMAFDAPNTLVVGSYGGRVQVTQNATAAQPQWIDLSIGLPSFDPNMYTGRPWITSLAVSGTTVWVTIGTGAAFGRVQRTYAPPGPNIWTSVDGSLPYAPVNSIALDPTSPGTVYVGTDAGAYVCGDCTTPPPNGSPFPWATIGSGMPNARIDAVAVQHDNAAILAFTHGRGAFTLPHRTAFSANPASIDFGYGTVGTAGPNTQVFITGAGVTASTGVSANVTGPNAGDFTVQTGNFLPPNCQGLVRLAPQAGCQLVLNFTPSAEGTRTATLVLSDAQGGGLTIPLSGIGSHPVVSLSPTSLDFGSLNVGHTSAQQTATVSNTGQGPLTVSQVGTSGDFNLISNNCYLVVSGGHSCSISITFSPTAHGTRTGTLTITDNAPGSPHTVSLTGFGTQPIVSLSATTLNFPDTPYPSSTAAPTLPLTISNTGDGLLTVQSIVASIPDYSVAGYATPECYGGTIPPSQSCTANIAFTPTALGPRNGTLTITDDASPKQQMVSAAGNGVPAPFASFDTGQVQFGTVNIGTTAAPIPVKLTNSGTASLTNIAISLTASTSYLPIEFGQTSDCPSSLAVGQSCTITVTFTPASERVDFADLSVSDNEANSPQLIPIYGEGASVTLSFQPNAVTFPDTPEGTRSLVQKVQIVKTGNGLLTITRTTSSSKDFMVTNDCPPQTRGGLPCSLYLTFTPTTIGPLSGTILVYDNATDGSSPQTVTVSGNGTASPVVSLSPSGLSFPFPPPPPGTASAPKTVTLSNTGHAALTISGISTTDDFAQTNTCGTLPASLPAGGSCTINVTFSPTTLGDHYGTLLISDNAPYSPQSISLFGTTNLAMSSGPDVSSWGPGRLDVFALGSDGAVWHKFYDSSVGWQGWSSLGAPSGVQLTSDPTAVSWGRLRIDVFVKGNDNALWHKYYDANYGGWSGWYSHGGNLSSAPDAASWGYGRLDVFAKGVNNDLQHIFYSPYTGWSNWYSHGGNLTSSPAAVSWGNGRIDVFARGTANNLQHIFYDVALNGWSSWYSHGGSLSSGPDVSSWGPGRLDVFAVDSQSTAWQLTYDSRLGGWQPWVSLAGSFIGDLGAVSWGRARIDVFGRGSDNVLVHSYYAGGVWSYWYRG